MRRRSPFPVMLLLAAAAWPAAARADLAGTLHRFVERHGSVFQDAVFDTLTPVLEHLAVRGTDLPPVATSLGFVYRYDPDSGAMQREAGTLGAMFVDRPRTMGRHVLAVGAVYEHADLTRYEGHELAPQVVLQSGVTSTDGSAVVRTLSFTDLDVTAEVTNLYATFGLGDAWDVNLLLPVVVTSLDVAAEKVTVTREAGRTVAREVLRPSTSDTATGIGDVLLRSKWRLTEGPLQLGAVLGLRAPTGASGDFQGLGDWVVEPDLLLARDFGLHEVHCIVGTAVNADAPSRSRARYGVGGSLQPRRGLALFADVLGTSAFTSDEFDVTSPNDAFVRSAFLDQFQAGPRQLDGAAFRVAQRMPRTDLVDADVGVKWSPAPGGFVYASVLVPVVRDGFRAVAIPSVGVQWVF